MTPAVRGGSLENSPVATKLSTRMWSARARARCSAVHLALTSADGPERSSRFNAISSALG
jgi:hypothetical protein